MDPAFNREVDEDVEVGIPQSPESLASADNLNSSEQQLIPTGWNIEEICDSGDEVNHSLDDQWLISIHNNLEEARLDDPPSSQVEEVCIYRIPENLRWSDERDNEPRFVSLGPFQYYREHLMSMERHKWRALRKVLQRTDQEVQLYLNSIQLLEHKARSCYEGALQISSKEFVEMMILDGCFMLEFFRGSAEGFTELGYSANDPVFAMGGFMHSLRLDMIMLENQIPYLILNCLYHLQRPQLDKKNLVEIIWEFLKPLIPNGRKSDHRWSRDFSFTPLHCLDVFHGGIIGPRMEHCQPHGEVADNGNSVTDLRESGIKLKKTTNCFWDINFKNGVLQIPRVLINDGTRSLFFNLIAFEQCHPRRSNVITAYLTFMDNLIDSPEDFSYLHNRGIIQHSIGSDAEAADFFSRLCQRVVLDTNNSYISELLYKVSIYNSKWNVWLESLKQDYFKNPWAIISFLAAIYLLMLASTQTFYGAYSYHHPRS